MFFGASLEKAVAALTGNLIGADRVYEVNKIIRAGLTMNGIFALFAGCVYILYPDPLLQFFYQNPELLDEAKIGHHINTLPVDQLIAITKSGLTGVYLYVLLQNIRWVFSGILSAAGDTLFLMLAGSLSVWVCMVIPTYVLMVQYDSPILTAYYIWVIYAAVNVCIVGARYYRGKWIARCKLVEKS